MPLLTPQQIQDDRMAKLQKLNSDLHTSAIRGNETSAEYRKNLTAINDKLILIALGTDSLLITFIGILFNSEKDTSKLEFKFLVLGIIGFLLTVIALLLARWTNSMYTYNTVYKYYLQDMKARDKLELLIMETPGLNINSETYEIYNPEDLAERIKQFKTKLKRIDKQIKKNKSHETRYNKFSKLLMLLGYALMCASYLSTLYFLIGVIEKLNS